jgi:hypothetical protein
MGCLTALAGATLIVAGLNALLFWSGYSTMINPSLPDSEWWAEWAARAFAGEFLAALILGIVMAATGCWLLTRAWRRAGEP